MLTKNAMNILLHLTKQNPKLQNTMKSINITECQKLLDKGATVKQEKYGHIILEIDDYKLKPFKKKGSYRARELVAV